MNVLERNPRRGAVLLLLVLLFNLSGCAAKSASVETGDKQAGSDDLAAWAAEEWEREEGGGEAGYAVGNAAIPDPLEPMNRIFFTFNDKLYFWLLKPVARVYAGVLPVEVRGSLKGAVHNLLMPVRFTNNLLQGKIKNSGVELTRFLVNTTLGIGGLADPARTEFGLEPREEDFGQSLGTWGVGDGFYICWPLFGPSSARDTLGLVGDGFLDPTSYLFPYTTVDGIAGQGGIRVNKVSLELGEYEDFKASSFDPYVAIRDAYKQYRDSKIKDAATVEGYGMDGGE